MLLPRFPVSQHDISIILAKKKEYAKGNLHDRHTLRNERDIAIRAGNVQEVARLDKELADMDGANQAPQANGSGSASIPQNKGPMTLEERRRQLAMSSMAVGAPKAVAGKTASPAISRWVLGRAALGSVNSKANLDVQQTWIRCQHTTKAAEQQPTITRVEQARPATYPDRRIAKAKQIPEITGFESRYRPR